MPNFFFDFSHTLKRIEKQNSSISEESEEDILAPVVKRSQRFGQMTKELVLNQALLRRATLINRPEMLKMVKRKVLIQNKLDSLS